LSPSRTERTERATLVVAAASAVTAYLTAHVVPAGSYFPAVGLSVLLTAPALFLQWSRVPATLVRPVRLALVCLLVAAFSLTVLSRQIPALPDDVSLRWAIAIGAALSACALLFLYAGRPWGVAKGILLAIAGILSVAALNERAPGFLALASVSGLALWTHAVLTGGPRRRGRAVALFVLGGVALAAGTILFLPWAEPHVTRFVAQAYSDGRSGLSDSSELGEVERLALSRRVVARVWTSAPQRLRMQVFDRFDGHRWSVGRWPQRSVEASPTEPLGGLGPLLRGVPGRTFVVVVSDSPEAGVETRVVPALAFDDGWGLLVPASTTHLRLPGDSVAVDDLGRMFAPAGFPLVYGIAGPHRGPALGRAEPSAADLQLPSPVDPGVRRLADALAERHAREDQRLAGTIDLLQSRPYRYTLDVGAFEKDDPIAEFLLRKKAGYCEYFATSAVLLLRLQGIPARYVKGVTVRPESRVGDHYVVRESDAHAWVEAYLPGTGWVEADPTPPRDYAAVHDERRPGTVEVAWEALRARVAVAWATLRQGGWSHVKERIRGLLEGLWMAAKGHPMLIFLGLLAVLGATGVLGRCVRFVRLWLTRRRLVVPPEPDTSRASSELRALLRRVERQWTRRGHTRPPTKGLREHLEALPREALTPAERETSAAVVDSYYRVSFGGVSLGDSDLLDLSARVASLR
jgi:transglutaminase-like putative cysteine protease